MDSTASRLHPLLAAAAVSVIVFSAIGVVALTGKMSGAAPGSIGAPQSLAPAAVAAPAPSVAPTPAVAPAPALAPEVVPAPKPRTVKKPVVRVAAPAAESLPPAAPVATPVSHAPAPAAYPVAQARSDLGVVESVREVKEKGDPTWMGPVAGGIGGAVLGSQVGKGTTRTIMGVLGAAGGAYAGREIEKHVRATKHWEVTVRMDDGSVRSVNYASQPAWRGGERVRIENGTLSGQQA
jgi:outer membrane lipoprotein SlyB